MRLRTFRPSRVTTVSGGFLACSSNTFNCDGYLFSARPLLHPFLSFRTCCIRFGRTQWQQLMSRLVQAPQDLLRWSFSKPTMIQQPKAVRHKPPPLLSSICQKIQVQPTQISNFQRYHVPPLSTWFRRTQIRVITLVANLGSRLSDGITLPYRISRFSNRKQILNTPQTRGRSLPCECWRAGKSYYSALVRSKSLLTFIFGFIVFIYVVVTGLNVLLLLIPASVSHPVDNERVELM